jgi:hypothetical protein
MRGLRLEAIEYAINGPRKEKSMGDGRQGVVFVDEDKARFWAMERNLDKLVQLSERHGQSKAGPEKWEYELVQLVEQSGKGAKLVKPGYTSPTEVYDLRAFMNDLGKSGWEMVSWQNVGSAGPGIVVFKRRL